jgi:hypothetical protein
MRPDRALACAALLVLPACGGDDALRSVSSAAQSVLQSARDAIDAARAYTREHQIDVRATLEEKFRALTEGIKFLQASIERAGRKARPEWRSALDGLQDKKAAVREKFLEYRAAGEQSWDRFRPQLERALDDLERAYLRCKEIFR